MGTQATRIIRNVYQDGLFLLRLKNKLLDDSYLLPEHVTAITAQVLQDRQYTGEMEWDTMRANGATINNAIVVPTSALLDTPVACTNDAGESDYYNFEWIFGPRIFPIMNRSNMIIVRFDLVDGKYFFSPRIICRVI